MNLHVQLSVPHTRMQLNNFVPPAPARVVTSASAPPPGPPTESSDLVESKQMYAAHKTNSIINTM
jgi:hypothetical protein